MSSTPKSAAGSLSVKVTSAVCPDKSADRVVVRATVGAIKSTTNGAGSLESEVTPTTLSKRTVSAPAPVSAACRPAGVDVPKSKVTSVSVAAITRSFASTRSPSRNSACPPVAAAAAIGALTRRLVVVRLTVLGTSTPPTGSSTGVPGRAGGVAENGSTNGALATEAVGARKLIVDVRVWAELKPAGKATTTVKLARLGAKALK